jgi:hypothetical protein
MARRKALKKNKSVHWKSATNGAQSSVLAARVTDLRDIAEPNFSKYRHGQ